MKATLFTLRAVPTGPQGPQSGAVCHAWTTTHGAGVRLEAGRLTAGVPAAGSHLANLGGEQSVQQACAVLGIAPTRFHQRVSANTSRTKKCAHADKCQYIPNRAI